MGWVVAGCTPQPPPPNMLLIIIDTLRADHTSAYGYPLDTTPHLRALASEGVRFERTYSPSSTTGPSVASLLTAHYPAGHEVSKNGQPLASHTITMAEHFRHHGFETAGFVSSFVLDDRFGFGRGFDIYDAEFTQEGETHPVENWAGAQISTPFDRRAEETTRRAIEWLENRPDPRRPFLLVVHYFDPHFPYVPPEPFLDRFGGGDTPEVNGDPQPREIQRYDEEIAYTDDQIGRLLAGLETTHPEQPTIVGVIGDHGEGLGDHGVLRHGLLLYEPFVRVPWILRLPGGTAAGTSVSTPVSLVDVLPTLSELAGLEPASPGSAGRSLAGRILRDQPLEEMPIFFQRRHYEPGTVEGRPVEGMQYGVRLDHWKYLEAPDEGTVELYDLQHDEPEQENEAARRPDQVARLRALLTPWLANAGSTPAVPLEETSREALEALGYVE